MDTGPAVDIGDKRAGGNSARDPGLFSSYAAGRVGAEGFQE